MHTNDAPLDRRSFLSGSAFALALPWLESTRPRPEVPRRLVCIYMPDGVPMPLPEDPAHADWAWFPHGSGRDFTFTKCLDPLEPLRNDLTVLSGLSHPSVRGIHGHSNADQFLTGAPTGATGEYRNSISIDQVYAAHVGERTRYSSLVLSTDGGTGTPRGAHTLSFARNGRAIPARHRPKPVFDALFVKRDVEAGRQLASSESALDALLEDARALRPRLSRHDQRVLDEYLDAVREAELKVEKAKRWLDVPLPSVNREPLELEVTPDDPRVYLQTMLELIHLAFRTDSTRVATFQLGRENGIGRSDHLSRAVGFPLAHQLSHETKAPGGWKNFGTYCRFLSEELGHFLTRLKATPEPGGEGSLLDNTLVLFGSASSAFHLSRNYPLILAGGKSMGFKHGQYLDHAGAHAFRGSWEGGREPWQREFTQEDLPLANLFVTMLQHLGVDTDTFADSTGALAGV